MKKLLAISALALALFLASRQPAHNPAGVDSQWRAEIENLHR